MIAALELLSNDHMPSNCLLAAVVGHCLDLLSGFLHHSISLVHLGLSSFSLLTHFFFEISYFERIVTQRDRLGSISGTTIIFIF